jgi:SAM-dependent methyltransferase/uncharacterized protein YbaR (Trm112 family)
MPQAQTIDNKKGEIIFRQKLAEQFAGKRIVYPGEPTGKEYVKIVKGRIKDYTCYFDKLLNKNILQGPYLELGAGVGQGAMLLENNYNLHGFTSDISFETLALAPKYQKVLTYKKMPFRICCDIYNLPFSTGSIPFIFTFQTLHHLPDPYPVLKEVKRVLAPGGTFYFNEEPVAQKFNLNLWRRDLHLRWFEKILKYLVILHFISRIGKSEVDHNILEETFSLSTWERALNLFSKAEVNLSVFPLGPIYMRYKTKKRGWLKGFIPQRFMLEIMGGGIGAICKNEDKKSYKKTKNVLACLACPNCKPKPLLHFNQKENSYFCNRCKSIFPIKNGILMLLSSDQKRELYTII